MNHNGWVEIGVGVRVLLDFIKYIQMKDTSHLGEEITMMFSIIGRK